MLELLEQSALAVWVRESPSIFAYTLVLSLHVIGLGIVAGLNTLIALRVLGVAPGIPLASLRAFYPLIWFGFAINAVSGVLLFIAEATGMSAMPAFWAKLAFVAIGMIVSLRLKARCFGDGPDSGVVTPAAKRLAVVSLAAWCLAIVVGRLTGYPELVHAMFGV
jgi:hypothetical protein